MTHKAPFVRSPYNYDVEAASNESAYVETMPSLTVQSMTEDADLNVLMKRFGVTGKLPENTRLPTYADFSHITDYRSAIEAARQAEDSFNEFPADIRAQFQNDPQLFLDYCENPANIKQLQEWFPKEDFDARSGSVRGDNQTADAAGAPAGAAAPQRGAGAGGTPDNRESAPGK